MIAVDDELYQWDSGHVVILTGGDANADTVHFAQYCSRADALVVEVQGRGGARVADIPNSLLTEANDLMVWTWQEDKTISGKRFGIISRNRPADYVYKPTEVLNYEHLKQWMLDKFKEFENAKVDDYEALKNKPRINDVELVGNKQFSELGIEPVTDEDIDNLFA